MDVSDADRDQTMIDKTPKTVDTSSKEPISVSVEVQVPFEVDEEMELKLMSKIETMLSAKAFLRHNEMFEQQDETMEYPCKIRICVDEESLQMKQIAFWNVEIKYYFYELTEEEEADEYIEDGIPGCAQYLLPCSQLEGIWETLEYGNQTKQHLLKYAISAMQFTDSKVDPKIITWNRLILSYGPPGTGKTSLCKGLAQKLSIRLSKRYPYGQLLEINAHSLFSKWFSESGKLILKLFTKLRQLIEDPEAFLCVLIDEVESLSTSRQGVIQGSEPSDALRATNALLTQLDSLKRYPNVLILTTSNLTEAIDTAFLDRADLKLYIGNPVLAARKFILLSCLEELIKKKVIVDDRERSGDTENQDSLLESVNALAVVADGLSGRALRRLPFQAHVLYCRKQNPSLREFCLAMKLALQHEREGIIKF